MKRHARPRDFRTVQSRHREVQDDASSDDVYARITVFAYDLYEKRGRGHGYDVEDWIQAEKAVLEQLASQQEGSGTRPGLSRRSGG
jgi:hypothetical protein